MWKSLLGVVCLLAACGSEEGADSVDPVDPGATPGEFRSLCTENSQCNSDVCVFRAGNGNGGFCSKSCTVADDCGENFDCDVIGGEALKFCIPEDRLDECRFACSAYQDNECFLEGKLSPCQAACEDADVSTRKAFIECSLEGGSDDCEESCLESLSPGQGPWTGGPPTDCMRDAVGDQACIANGLLPAAYVCFEDTPSGNCQASPFGGFCCDS